MEVLAFTWACEHFSEYLIGLKFHIQIDHKPLVPLFSTKSLDELPVRVQQFRLRMLRCDFTISLVADKNLAIADTPSRAPTGQPQREDEELQEEARAFINLVIESLPVTEQKLEKIKQGQKQDRECQEIVQYTRQGWPRKSQLTRKLRRYYPTSAEINAPGSN